MNRNEDAQRKNKTKKRFKSSKARLAQCTKFNVTCDSM